MNIVKKEYRNGTLHIETTKMRININREFGAHEFEICVKPQRLSEIMKMPWPFDINEAYINYGTPKETTTIRITGRDFYPDLEREFRLELKKDILSRIDPEFWELYKQLYRHFKISTGIKIGFDFNSLFDYKRRNIIKLTILNKDFKIEKILYKPIIAIKNYYRTVASSKMKLENAVKAINRIKAQVINDKLGK